MNVSCSLDAPKVVHSEAEKMFSICVEEHEAAYLRYRYLDPALTKVEMFTTVVPPSLGGRGVAKLLADDAFNWAVENEKKLKLTCWYLTGYLERHPRDDVTRLLIS